MDSRAAEMISARPVRVEVPFTKYTVTIYRIPDDRRANAPFREPFEGKRPPPEQRR